MQTSSQVVYVNFPGSVSTVCDLAFPVVSAFNFCNVMAQAKTQEAEATRKKYNLQKQAGKSRYEVAAGQRLAVSQPRTLVLQQVLSPALSLLVSADTDSGCSSIHQAWHCSVCLGQPEELQKKASKAN